MNPAGGRGVVHGAGGGVYRVVLEDGSEVEASLRGRLKQEARTGDRVVVGDRVRVASGEGSGADCRVIEEVFPRETSIVRRSGPGRHPKVVAANLDRLIVVVAARDPEPRPEVVDRFLVLAESDHVPVVLAINKVDLPGARELSDALVALYGAIGYRVIAASAVSGEGIDELRAVLCDGTSALVGPSGVGKSSLLNALEPGLALRTGELSRKLARGRHTTVSSRLVPLECGGLVADTPGFGEVGVWGVDPGAMDGCFPEMAALRDECRFRGCSHLHEPGCAVLAAVAGGTIAPSRHQSYRTLREEAAGDVRPGR